MAAVRRLDAERGAGRPARSARRPTPFYDAWADDRDVDTGWRRSYADPGWHRSYGYDGWGEM